VSWELHHGLAPLAAEWDELADRTGAPPFLRPGWYAIWCRSFGRGIPEVLAVRGQGRLAAVLPLLRRGRTLHGLANWHTPALGAVAEDAEAEAALARILARRRAIWIELRFVDVRSPLAVEWRRVAEAAGHRVLIRTVERSPYLSLDGTWDALLASLPTRRRTELRRRRRRLEGEGAVELDVSDGRERLDAQLEEGFAVEARSWKGAAGTAIASRADTSTFYRELAGWASAHGWLRLAFLRCGGRAIAFDLALTHGGVHYLLKTGFDEAFARFGPGTLLRAAMLERAFSEGVRSYEFLGQAEAHKSVWTSTFRERAELRAFAPGAAGRTASAAFAYGRPAVVRMLERVGR
jgi:CelD/BcsL family acetyltransferase involved in cellulose biosynthesis